MTDHHHPAIAQRQRVMQTTAHDYGLQHPSPPRSPDEVREILAQHPQLPECSAEAI